MKLEHIFSSLMSTTGACQENFTECQFADDIALLASTSSSRGLQVLPVHSKRRWSHNESAYGNSVYPGDALGA